MHSTHGTNSPFIIIETYGRKLVNNEFTTGELKSMFDELSGYWNFFEEYMGEHSDEYKMANAMMVLSKNLKFTADNSSIKHWVAKYPLYKVWYSRVEELLNKPKSWKYGYSQEMQSTVAVKN